MFDLEKIVRKNIITLSPYSSARDEFSGKEGIFLDANENPFGIYNRYPDPYQMDLKKELSEIKKVQIENIFLSNGSDEVIDLAYRIFCNPGKDKVLTFSPTYGMYDVSAQVNDVKLINISLTEDFQLDLKMINPLLGDENIKLIFICSPNNPTGNSFNRTSIEYILQNFQGIVLIDEAYIDFSEQKSFVPEIEKYPNLVVMQTFSKAWGLASIRVGMAFTCREIIQLFNKVKPPYNISQSNQQMVLNRLRDKQKLQQEVQLIISERKRLEVNIKLISYVEKIYPSDANFILVKVKNADYIYQELISQKLIIRNRTKVINNCLRITVGSEYENNQLLRALNQIVL